MRPERTLLLEQQVRDELVLQRCLAAGRRLASSLMRVAREARQNVPRARETPVTLER